MGGKAQIGPRRANLMAWLAEKFSGSKFRPIGDEIVLIVACSVTSGHTGL